MEIKSHLLGLQQIDPDTIITFPKGIPGFESQHRYKLFHQEDNIHNIVYLLQSIDDESLTFSVTLPIHFNINYHFVLTDEEERILQLESVDDLLILILLHREEDPSTHDKPTIKGSIKSPLLINSGKRIGLQKVLLRVEQSITLAERVNEIDLTEL